MLNSLTLSERKVLKTNLMMKANLSSSSRGRKRCARVSLSLPRLSLNFKEMIKSVSSTISRRASGSMTVMHSVSFHLNCCNTSIALEYLWKARSPRQEKLLAAQEEMSMELGSMTKSTIELKEPFDCKRLKAHLASPKKHPPCPKAHNAVELELIPVTGKVCETLKITIPGKVQNLKGVIQVSKDQINNNKTLQAWVPANSKKEADIGCF